MSTTFTRKELIGKDKQKRALLVQIKNVTLNCHSVLDTESRSFMYKTGFPFSRE